MDKIQIWDMLLKFVPGKSATVAGGAVRDYLNGRDEKDIDIFINIDQDQPYNYRGIPDNIEMRRKNNVNINANPEYQIDGLGNGVQCIDNFDVNLVDEDIIVPVQFIYVNGSVREYILRRFDLDFCQAWYRKGIVSTTVAFNRACNTNTVRNINGFAGDHRTRAHANRVIDRAYNGWVYEEMPVPIAAPPVDLNAQIARAAEWIRVNPQPQVQEANQFVIQGNGIRFANPFPMNNEPI